MREETEGEKIMVKLTAEELYQIKNGKIVWGDKVDVGLEAGE